jgi:hypothetical protein
MPPLKHKEPSRSFEESGWANKDVRTMINIIKMTACHEVCELVNRPNPVVDEHGVAHDLLVVQTHWIASRLRLNVDRARVLAELAFGRPA